jgi:hypothetical protein
MTENSQSFNPFFHPLSLALQIIILVPRQSTRHKYKSRRERNAETAKKAKLLLLFGGILAVLLLIKNWREYYAWLKTYFY